MITNPKVSVFVISYNQAQFIAQTLESILSQHCSFEYEIVVGDDGSTDGTIEIIKGFESRWPERIKPIFHEKNVGMMRNVVDTFNACRGEYVACLEGDDYWTDIEKLQRQVDYLDQNQECAVCHHRVNHIAWPGGRVIREFPPARYRAARTDGRDLALFNYLQTCSAVFRRKWLPSFDAEFESLKLGDWPLFVLLSQRGWIGYLDRTMADYRVHGSNSWNNRAADYKIRAMERMALYLLDRVDSSSKNLWEDTLLAIAFKDFALAVRSLSPAKSMDRLRNFLHYTRRFRKPFWVFNRLWLYVRANYVK